MNWVITFFCACWLCCGKPASHPAYGVTRSGAKVREGITAACDPSLLGRIVVIKGLGARRCEDTGGAIHGKRVDVYVPSHEYALQLGRKRMRVEVLK